MIIRTYKYSNYEDLKKALHSFGKKNIDIISIMAYEQDFIVVTKQKPSTEKPKLPTPKNHNSAEKLDKFFN